MITVSEFKNHFTRDFPYIPYWEEGKAYFKDDVVYVSPNFYISKIDANLSPVSDTESWSIYNDTTENYLSDTDIQKAIAEATMGFNEALFDNEKILADGLTECKLAMLYLTAFYLVLDIKNSTSGLSSNAYTSFTTSKSVGNVHESFGIPSWAMNNPMYSLYLDNGYGKKYLSYLIPRITGWFYLSKGATTWDV
ncbi:MAG: DUF4054 domain-containing protein [Acutalibacteraceae bacterium]|nr:DUF4054 domain-containing protein [Acutalibacteraceae bacterium]